MTVIPRPAITPVRDILVTSGAGFIGSHVVDALLAEGIWRVVVVDNFDDLYAPQLKRANVSPHAANAAFVLCEVDIRDTDALRVVFARHDFVAIVHLAALAGVRPSIVHPASYVDVNVSGTLNVLECAREFAVPQFVLGSSSSVYGRNAVPFCEEDATAQPMSPYAASKMAAELLCHTYSHLYGVRCLCLRFFTVYGPRQRPDLAICKFARLMCEGRPVPVFGDGGTRRDYTHVDDVVQGIRAAVEYDASLYEVFNLGGSRPVELRALISLLEQSLARKALLDCRAPQAGDMAVTFADVSKASKMLGYKPKTDIRHGIEKFVARFLDSPHREISHHLE